MEFWPGWNLAERPPRFEELERPGFVGMRLGLGTEKYGRAQSLLRPRQLEEILENLGRIFEWELRPEFWHFRGRAAFVCGWAYSTEKRET
ncbi:hypothetical protein Pyn_24990 [Prunus yedoensis var. nudiflora]|uniref:Uncharacterized protein n=1 Tax=Prunus yedoensis var. nudiflora TaxID=2094558 RepID=A0A314ZDV5_PRUYE|nr:hypothetical protein Pyn_24990 [Prunus yedoensis var. nudiflora]